MPISDLLAEISGDRSSPGPPVSRPSSTPSGVKRKADGDPSESTTKSSKARHAEGTYLGSSAARTPNGDGRQTHSMSRAVPRKPSPPPASRQIGSAKAPATTSSTQRPSGVGATSSGAQSYAGTSTSSRPGGKPSGPSAVPPKKSGLDSSSRPKLNPSTLAGARVAPARPSPTTPTTSESSKAPKKGSFAEIMARGAKAQQIMPKAGVIQHKAIEKPLGRKEREEQRAATSSAATSKPSMGKKPPGSNGAGGKSSTSGPSKVRDGQKAGSAKALKSSGEGRASGSGSEGPEKKVKKAAVATTGYTGTARPVKSSSSKPSASRNGHASSSRSGGLLAPPKMGRRREEDEYDEELDDFIVDDEDEEPAYGMGRRYDYNSDGSSDMEAGMDDIYMEESRADRMARDEDRQEEARLERLKREKEARKRMAYR